ncbi:MAG: hypothetical protein AAF637_26190, partial [Pseudomonadota bacterium]
MTDRGCRTWFRAATWPLVLSIGTLMGGATVPLFSLGKLAVAQSPAVIAEENVVPAEMSLDMPADAPLADLNKALSEARAKLEQLDRATAALAGVASLRAELDVKEQENRQLRAELQTLRERRAEWQRSEDAAKAQISGLGQALDEAAEDTKRLEGELADLRWQNAQLETTLGEARSEAEAVRSDLSAQVSDLTTRVEDGASEIQRLTEALAQRDEDLVAAANAERAGTARLAALETAVAGAEDHARSLGDQLTAANERLRESNKALAASEQERDGALAARDEEMVRADRLQDELAVAETDLQVAQAANRELEQAASAATDTAWQNLRAVESQIATLASTLADAELSASIN